MKDNPFLVESLKKLLRRGATTHLHNLLLRVRPADLAEAFRSLDEPERLTAFRLLAERATKNAADLLVSLHSTIITDLLGAMNSEEIARVLHRVADDDVAEILSLCPEEERETILSLMKRDASKEVQDLLGYEEETAGRIMTTRFLALPDETLVQEAISAVQRAQEAEMVFYLYVVDQEGRLEGVLSLRRLLMVSPQTTLKTIMSTDVISVRAETDQEEVARIASRYDLLAVPVVDGQNVLAGIVTIDDVIDVMREEATEDFYKLAGTSDEERLLKSTLRSAGIRLPWLFAAFIGGLVAALLIKGYAPLITEAALLVCFLPVVLGMGGNIGTQAATIMVRGLSTGRISPRHVGGVIFKEIRIALLLGTIYGLLLGLAAVFLIGLDNTAGVIVGLSLLVSMAIAAVVGSMLPMLLKLVHIDPAVATSPFVTTAVDLLGLLAFFTLAGRYLVVG
jgi:magnesium transporter